MKNEVTYKKKCKEKAWTWTWEAFYPTLLSINKPARAAAEAAACSQPDQLKAYIDRIKSKSATQESSDGGLPSPVRLCVMPLYAFIWLSSQLTIEAWICHCTCDLRKKVLWSHIRAIAASPCPHSTGRNQVLSWLLFYLNVIQNVCAPVHIGTLGSGNNPSHPQPPPPRYISSSRGI